jgi:tetratricopeptide (TPR) repeat protein
MTRARSFFLIFPAAFLSLTLTLVAALAQEKAPLKNPPKDTVDFGQCAAPDINKAIRGCTAVIKAAPASKATIAKAYFNRGKAHAKRGAPAAAVADFSEAIRLSPKNADAHCERGASYEAQGDKARAEADFAAAMQLDPAGAKAYVYRGWLYKSNGEKEKAKVDFDQAVALADKAIAAKKDLANAYYLRAEARAGLEEYDLAIADDNEALRLKPDDEVIYKDRGVIYSLKGNKDLSVADYTKALGLQPDYWRALSERGFAYVGKRDFDRALVDYDRAIVLNKDSAQNYYNRGYAHRIKEDNDKAIADISEALRLKPNFANAYANRAWAYAAKKDFEQADTDFEHFIQLERNSADAYTNRSDYYFMRKDYDRAIMDLSDAIKISSNESRYYKMRADVYYLSQKYKEAVADLETVINLNPNDSEAYISRARSYRNMRRYDNALSDLGEAIRLKPEQWTAYNIRAELQDDLNKLDEAISDFKEVIKRVPDSQKEDYCLRLSQTYHKKGDKDRAIAELTQLLSRKSDSYMAYALRAMYYTLTGELDAVIADATEMIRLRPDAPEGYETRGRFYWQKKDISHALSDITQAIRLNPEKAFMAYYTRAAIYNNSGEYGKAASDASQAIEIAQRYKIGSILGGCYDERALAWANLENFEHALSDYDHAVQIQPNDSDVFSKRGTYYYWRKQYELAINDFDQALKLDPRDTRARIMKAYALVDLGSIDEAKNAVDAGLKTGKDQHLYLAARCRINYILGHFSQALDDCNQTLALSDLAESPRLYATRAKVYEKLGRKTSAIEDYKKAIGLKAADPAQREARVEANDRLAALEAELGTAPKPQPVSNKIGEPKPPFNPGRRIALVIGVGGYEHVTPLPNPTNDAKSLGDTLRGLHFADVKVLLDPSRAEFAQELALFGDKAKGADWAFVFYAGHGVQLDGRNYLIPKDANVTSKLNLKLQAIVADDILESVSGAKNLHAVILDACRNTPLLPDRALAQATRDLSAPRGLAPMESGRGDELVIFATAANSTAADGAGDHSPFTAALLEHLKKPGIDIGDLIGEVRDAVKKATGGAQVPYTYSSLGAEKHYVSAANE